MWRNLCYTLVLLYLALLLGLLVLPGCREGVSGGGGAEVGVEAFATPCGLDEEDGCFGRFLQGEAEGEFGADFRTVLTGAESGGEFAGLLAGFLVEAADGRNPHAPASPG